MKLVKICSDIHSHLVSPSNRETSIVRREKAIMDTREVLPSGGPGCAWAVIVHLYQSAGIGITWHGSDKKALQVKQKSRDVLRYLSS